MQVLVTGIAIISCLGDSFSTWKAICEQKSGVKLHRPFSYFPPLPLGLIDSQPSAIHQLTLDLVKQTLESANLSTPLTNMGVVIGSSRGCQFQLESINSKQIVDKQSTQINYPWWQTLPCLPSTLVAQLLETQAPVLSPMNACATGLVAIAQGYELIQLGLCERVIVGAVETPITPLTVAGFQKMTALATTGCYPFDKNREGLVLGEGGAMLVLETANSALKRGAKIYGERCRREAAQGALQPV